MRTQPDKSFDIAIIDPQTGQGEGKNHTRRPKTVLQDNGNRLSFHRDYHVSDWDSIPPTQEFYDELFRVSRHQIIMCENFLHFDQKKSSAGRIIWNLLRDNNFSDCQIMWTSLFQRIDYFEYMWNGMMQGTTIGSRVQQGNKSLNQKRIHPSEKPIIMYRHLLREYCNPWWSVLDTHMGSGSLAIACNEEKHSYTGTELDPINHSKAVKRFNLYMSQPKIS